MIEHDYYVEEKEIEDSIKLEDCRKCPSYETCEIKNIISPADDCPKVLYSNGIKVFLDDEEELSHITRSIEGFIIEEAEEANTIQSTNSSNSNIYSDSSYETDEDKHFILPYIYRENGIDYCVTSNKKVTVVECGNKQVADGIGEHYKINIETFYDSGAESDCCEILLDSNNRWSPQQPVFISAQTGQGKNNFIENFIIPYVHKLNYENKTAFSVLIISNRLALEAQIKNRLEYSEDADSEDIIHYSKEAFVMTYQSVLKCYKRLEKWQKQLYKKNLFVICDEAHFITSDAMFNPDTEKILSAIVKIFSNAIRVYMSATPYECLKYIIDAEKKYYMYPLKQIKEYKGEKYDKQKYHRHKYDDYMYEHQQMVFYHFQRNYDYIDLFAFSEYKDLFPIIGKRLNLNQKWLIFIDDKKMAASVKEAIDAFLNSDKLDSKDKSKSDSKSIVMVVSAESKDDEQYISMVKSEHFVKGISILISTSVLDNGINFRDVDNIVISDASMVKCLQMVGRARIDRNKANDRKTVYVKRFSESDIRKHIKSLDYYLDFYHRFDLGLNIPYSFMEGDERERETIKHLFQYTPSGETYFNPIARQLIEQQERNYQAILREFTKESQSGDRFNEGLHYLKYEFSWFGKQYSDDLYVDKSISEKSRNEFIAFLKNYCEKSINISKEMQGNFSAEFTKYYDEAFGRADKNKSRSYGLKKMKDLLDDKKLGYTIISEGTPAYWRVCDKGNNASEAKSE